MLSQAEREVAALERRRDELAEQLAAAGPAGDHEELARLGTALAEVQGQLSEAEERWLSLAEESES